MGFSGTADKAVMLTLVSSDTIRMPKTNTKENNLKHDSHKNDPKITNAKTQSNKETLPPPKKQ